MMYAIGYPFISIIRFRFGDAGIWDLDRGRSFGADEVGGEFTDSKRVFLLRSFVFVETDHCASPFKPLLFPSVPVAGFWSFNSIVTSYEVDARMRCVSVSGSPGSRPSSLSKVPEPTDWELKSPLPPSRVLPNTRRRWM